MPLESRVQPSVESRVQPEDKPVTVLEDVAQLVPDYFDVTARRRLPKKSRAPTMTYLISNKSPRFCLKPAKRSKIPR